MRAGWAGVLTFPRELYLAGDALGSRPATELTGLRQQPLAWSPGVPFSAAAFELEVTVPLRLSLHGASGDVLVTEVPAPAPGSTNRILVDGSLVEVFAGPTAFTTRAYPTATSGWLIRAEPSGVRAWQLGL